MPKAVRDSRVLVPQLPPRHISRTRLLAELDMAADLPLTLLSAGPGAGKTVLLTELGPAQRRADRLAHPDAGGRRAPAVLAPARLRAAGSPRQ